MKTQLKLIQQSQSKISVMLCLLIVVYYRPKQPQNTSYLGTKKKKK